MCEAIVYLVLLVMFVYGIVALIRGKLQLALIKSTWVVSLEGRRARIASLFLIAALPLAVLVGGLLAMFFYEILDMPEGVGMLVGALLGLLGGIGGPVLYSKKGPQEELRQEITKVVTAHCSSEGAAVTLSFDVVDVVVELKNALEQRLNKKGIGIRWSEAVASSEVKLRLVEVDQGNQFLRWLLPFIAPAVLEVEGEVSVAASSPRPFHYVQKVQVGIFGGGAKHMLTTCAANAADKIAKDILDAMCL